MGEKFDRAALREYYGQVLLQTSDLKTGACCCPDDGLPPSVKADTLTAILWIQDETRLRCMCRKPFSSYDPDPEAGCRSSSATAVPG